MAETKKKIYIDVMIAGGKQFYCQLEYYYNPLFKIDIEDVERYVDQKRPTLKYRNDVVLVLDDKR